MVGCYIGPVSSRRQISSDGHVDGPRDCPRKFASVQPFGLKGNIDSCGSVDMTVDSSADEQVPTQVECGWSDGSSTDTVRDEEPRLLWESRAVFGGRRVVLVPASLGSTLRSVQDMQPSVGSNRFAVLADDDDVDIVTEDPPAPASMASPERVARPNRARHSSTHSTCQFQRSGRPCIRPNPVVMRSILKCFQYVATVRVSIQEILGKASGNMEREMYG